ncbi:polysaccharide biosynthesis tyrosine autokinase [Novosphingobium sp.]|uniref:GumC family protein n=1 Tax=Novosphingobium sp. TaxID=1874826 RepID=UPI001EC60A7A|nr:polysaccharide biosynthesis tyrosine autokinase [Novosphingobium sp.]MBK6800144.1 polysaccharide biosynthesis tyrosine autokinase [Novosphingobium sp.]MBK9010839.1 polysaccharide biosynthesis tyrosine autokinase [Novosphingobium sp.]
MNDTDAFDASRQHGHYDYDDPDSFRPETRSAIDFRYIAAAIRSNMILIIAIMLASLALAVVGTLLQTPRYTAATTIQINDAGSRVLGEQDDTTGPIANIYDTDRFLKTQTDIITSRGLATRVAQRLKLDGNAEFYRAQEVEPPARNTRPEDVRNLTINLLRANVSVKLPRDSRIVTISFESADKAYAARIANAFASEFIQANLQRKYDSTAYAREFVSGQLAESKVRLENSERALNDYARSAGLVKTESSGTSSDSDGGGASITTASLLQLNRLANDAKMARITAEGRWQAVSRGPLLGNREILANPAVSSLMTDRARAEAELQKDLATHLDDYPSVVSKRAQLDRISSQLQAVAGSVKDSIRRDLEAAVANEQRLMAQLTAAKSETMSEQDLNVQYALLEREADTNRTLYDALLQRYKELNAAAGISTSNVDVIDEAVVPGAPTSPSLTKNLLIALLAGMGLAALTVFLKDQLDDAIRVPEDVEFKLRMPLLGVVPKSQSSDPDEDLSDPKSPVSEAYNSLRGALLYSTTEGLPQVLLVTSAQASEGKTTTSYAVAAGLARMGRKTLLIDCDMRRPSVHRRIGHRNDRGLSTLLTGNDAPASAIQPSDQPELFVLPSGPVPPSPTELLSSKKMEQLVEEMAREFESVVIDTPPILGLADAPSLSALADGVIFVVESDRGRRGSLKTALRRLRAMRPILLGAVLTKFDPTRAGNRYSEYYGYNYYVYEADSNKKAKA